MVTGIAKLSLAKHPPKQPPYEAVTETPAVPAVGKLQTVAGPVVGEHEARHDDHWISDGLSLQPAVRSAHAPGCTGPDGLAAMKQVGGAALVTGIV